MADTKLTALGTVAAASDDDLLYLVNDPGGSAGSYQVSRSGLLSAKINTAEMSVGGPVTMTAVNASGTVSAVSALIQGSMVGVDLIQQINNSDNTNANSQARLHLETGGDNSGDPLITWRIGAAGQGYALGIDNNVSDTFQLTRQTALGGSVVVNFGSDGSVGIVRQLQVYGTLSGSVGIFATGSIATFTANSGSVATLTGNTGSITTLTGTRYTAGGTVAGTAGVFGTVTINAAIAVYRGSALGTPSSGTLTNCTGLPISTGVSGLAANVATFLATPSSTNLATAVTDETGSGALVFATSPTLVTPALGTPSSGTLTNCTGLPQGGLSTTTGEVSVTGEGQTVIRTLAGGQYGFWVQIKNSNVPTTGGGWSGGGASTTGFLTNITLTTSSGTGSSTTTAVQRYIQASPPYDLGDGDVPEFVFLLVDSGGNIVGTYVAQDPPWANNGPTSIRPDRYIGGKPFKMEWPRVDRAKLQNPATRDAELAKLTQPPQLIEITQAVKQADMPLIPHPFLGNDLTGVTVVLLDPVSALMAQLQKIQASGESVAELLHAGYFNISNSPLSRATPPGVIAVAANWK